MDSLRSAPPVPADASSRVDTVAEILEDIAAAEQEMERGEVIEHEVAREWIITRLER